MTDTQKAQKIKQDLYENFPEAQFEISVNGNEVDILFVGGYSYINEYPTHAQAADAIAAVVRETIPGWDWDSGIGADGKEIIK